jgi:hypothetical protein
MKSSEFFDLGVKPRSALGAMAIAGQLSLFVGIVVLVIGKIFLTKDRRQKKKE